MIRQNNTIIELCLRLSKQVESLEGRIRSLEAQKSPALSTDDLVAKIAKLSLGPKEKPSGAPGVAVAGRGWLVTRGRVTVLVLEDEAITNS